MQRSASIASGLVLLVAGLAGTSVAATCPVPSASHPTIQAAVDDLSCTEVVLAAQTFVESPVVARDLTVRGASSTATVVTGQVEVSGGQVALEDLTVDTSGPAQRGRFASAVWAHGGGRVSGDHLVVVHAPLLFGDGFETGGTSAWSSVMP